MVSEQDICRLLNEFNSISPLAFVQRIDISSMGIGSVLGYLCESGRAVSAGEISEYMGVSTARVAVLLKKMSEKELITKTSDPNDKRRVMVSITSKGIEAFKEKKREILLYSGAIVEHFGVKRVEDFIESCREIKAVVDKVEKEQASAPSWANEDIEK
ncbi:MAG: MarR family transcriptional regulator [Clostridiales bacterium]|nr:MarR family transcriptional regulator [Clostridiales bacterium]